MDELDHALQWVLINHLIAIEDRQAAETRPVSPDLSDIYAETRKTIRALCAGELEPRAYLAAQES